MDVEKLIHILSNDCLMSEFCKGLFFFLIVTWLLTWYLKGVNVYEWWFKGFENKLKATTHQI